MKSINQRVGAVFGLGAVIGLVFTGIGGAVVCGFAALIMGGFLLYSGRTAPDGGLPRALIAGGVTALVICALQIYGQRLA